MRFMLTRHGRTCSPIDGGVGDAMTQGRPHARAQLPQLRMCADRRLLPLLRQRAMFTARSAHFHDLARVFHIEGKIWRTLPLLAWKPGD
jgi:hypothetical protein